MNRFVLDCSVVMAWCFKEPSTAKAEEVLQSLASAEAWVPSLWPFEVANVLVVGERRRRITPADSSRFIALLGALPIRVDNTSSVHALSDALPIARAHDISAYDASYLELAMRMGTALASLDEKLQHAAKRVGLSLILR